MGSEPTRTRRSVGGTARGGARATLAPSMTPPRGSVARSIDPCRATVRGVAFAAIVLVHAHSALALPGPKPDKAAERSPEGVEYAKHMDNGVKLYQSGNFTGALIEFEAAYKAKPKASPLINEALCFREQHKYAEAVLALERALRDHGHQMDAKNKQAAEKAIAEMRELFAYLEITVDPPGAKVTVDGDEKSPTERASIALGPDSHTIVAEAEGFVGDTRKVTLASGDKRTINIKLVSNMGALHVRTERSDTAIEVDGQVVGRGEWTGPVTAGAHSVRLVGESETEPIDVAVGGTATIDKTKKPGPLPPIPIAPKPKELPPPPPRGFYGLVSGALLFTPAAPCAFLAQPSICKVGDLQNISRNAGGAAGVRAGYRVNTYAAFEGMFEYGNISGGREGGSESYSLTDLRLGPFLRLMSPGTLVHFVGTLGGGLAFDFVSFRNTGKFGPCFAQDQAAQCFKSWGVDFFVATDVGVEFNIQGVLLGAAFNVTGNALKGVDENPAVGTPDKHLNQFGGHAAILVGPRVHFGYAFW